MINWGGSTNVITSPVAQVINKFEAVAVAGNKLRTFQALEGKDGIRIPQFTTDRSVATGWLRNGISVVCRLKLSGHSGDGIVLVDDKTADLPQAPLYVQYIKKQQEYRVHVAFGEVIDVQEKRKRKDLPEDFTTNFQVRNHHTGWVYCREDLSPPDELSRMGLQIADALGLDFGAVDIIYNAKRNECYCLEVNCAPGLEGTTVTKYVDAFKKALS